MKLIGASGIDNQSFLDAAGPSAEGAYIVWYNPATNRVNGSRVVNHQFDDAHAVTLPVP